MLHDPRHDKTPSLAGFALFVASKDPKETYNWYNCQECAVGQYLKSMDRLPYGHDWSSGLIGELNGLARGARCDVWEPIDSSLHTWGQLADRILAHQMAEAV